MTKRREFLGASFSETLANELLLCRFCFTFVLIILSACKVLNIVYFERKRCEATLASGPSNVSGVGLPDAGPFFGTGALKCAFGPLQLFNVFQRIAFFAF